MGEIEDRASSAALRRWVFRLFGWPVLGAVFVSCVAVIVSDWRLGERSPGITEIARIGLHYYIPVLFIVFWAFPTLRNGLLIWRSARSARLHGLRWYEFLDLPAEERARLREQANRES